METDRSRETGRGRETDRGMETDSGMDRCVDCEYGAGYIELCECPVCHNAVILGDVRTREIHCPNGCSPLPFAVDFCAEMNCDSDVYRTGISYKEYQVTVRGDLNTEQAKVVSKYFKDSVAHIFLKVKRKESISKKMNIFEAKGLGKYLEEQGVEYVVSPELPLISRLDECRGKSFL